MEKKKVLVVDDERDVVEHVGSLLRSSGFEVSSSLNGKEALRLAVENRPDLIILDVALPDVDGGEVAHRLSLKQETQEIPVIFLTGLITKEEQQEPERMGKHFVIAKPALREELISTINKALQ